MKGINLWGNLRRHTLVRRFFPLLREDLAATYERNLHKWLLISPFIGVTAGLAITAIAEIVLRKLWPRVFWFYLQHHWAIVPGLTAGFAVIGLIMQFLTHDPNVHSTEEVIESYHEHEGAINMGEFPTKVLASIMTVGLGGSAALEGPSIYTGAAIGSWLWDRLHRMRGFQLTPRDRRIMLICGAAAGMSAVFRAPITGIVFALELPYKDDLAHEALMPSLIASVVSYMTLVTLMGSERVFNFKSGGTFSVNDLFWSALLGLLVGLIAMVFVITFRHLRGWVVRWAVPHWIKLATGGLLTGLCALIFLQIYPGVLVPIGPNYEAVERILTQSHGSGELSVFVLFKLAATAFSLGGGGVAAPFTPFMLIGESIGIVFAQSVAHSAALALYAAVGMASFIAAGYKTPLAAAVFVAEATGAPAFIIPALIGSAVAYAISGDASVSGDQKVHEGDAPHEDPEAHELGLQVS